MKENIMDKELFLEKLKKLDLNKKEFAFLCNTPYSTVNNWGTVIKDKTLPIPGWVEPFLEYYAKSKKLDYIVNDLCDKIKEVKNTI